MKALLSKFIRKTPAAASVASGTAPAPAQLKTPAKAASKAFIKTGKPVVEYLPDADEIERSPVPWMAQLTIWLVFAGLSALIAWASLAKLDQVVTATGTLVNPIPNVVVQPLDTSIIQTVDVRPGQTVRKGDLLATLDATFANADESQLRSRLKSLETQTESLQAELERGARNDKPERNGAKAASADTNNAGSTADQKLQSDLQAERRANYQAQQARLGESVGRLRAALATNRQDQQAIAGRLRSVKELEGMQEKSVAQKFGSAMQLLRELAAAEAEKLAFERGWRQKTMEDLLAITRERDSLREQLEKANKRQTLVKLSAPLDGVVLEIAKLSPGSVVRGAETFFTLVPLDVVLEAEAQIAASDIGYVKPGDEVRLKVDTFPFQKHGTLKAKVRSISQDAYKGDGRSLAANGGSHYLARLVLTDTHLDNLKPDARLLPGMSLNAEVVVGDRSVMSYLVWPLTKGLNEAIREP
jgi:hemolysin D